MGLASSSSSSNFASWRKSTAQAGRKAADAYTLHCSQEYHLMLPQNTFLAFQYPSTSTTIYHEWKEHIALCFRYKKTFLHAQQPKVYDFIHGRREAKYMIVKARAELFL